ncbi:SDR family oxidoreductase [Cellulomonas sp. SG140]|uniref:SDR family oxidoreductase n=1 Tax=Cellulomonas sp. SG140 TaxID=2976536 RepID=UPI0021E90694|nr:SDR family oxidoreductase [Cellulomonas sp. SG140]
MTTCAHSHVLVTGASSGIGRAAAQRLARSGYHVFAGVRKPADGAALAEAAGADVTPVILDVTDPQQVASAVELITAHVGDAGLAGLVNNAGIGVFGPLELIPLEQFRRQLDVNVTGQLAVTQAALPLLRRARGRIVMIGSIGARFTPPFVGPLAATKSALATMSAALRQELAPWDIHVTVVEPGSIRSEAVDKLESDAQRMLDEATPEGRALYRDAFGHLVDFFADLHEKGSPPEVVAATVERALRASRPRSSYLSGKNARRMAAIARLLPVPAQDALRRRIARQPARGALAVGTAAGSRL